MVNMLKNKISNVKESRFGSGIIRKGKFFREVDFKAEIGLPLFVLLVEERDLLFGISKGVCGNGEEFGILPWSAPTSVRKRTIN